MKENKSMLGAVIALVLCGLVYWGTRPNYGPVEHALLIDATPASVDGLEITVRGGETVKLVRVGADWQVVVTGETGETRPVPADTALVHEALASLVGVKITDTVSRKKNKVDLFGLTEVLGTRVVGKKGKTVVVSAMLGTVDRTGRNTFVRLTDGGEVVTLPGRLRGYFGRMADQWRKRELAAIQPTSVRSVAIEWEEASFLLRRTDVTVWEIAVNDGERSDLTEEIRPAAPESLLTALNGLKARSFRAEPVTGDAKTVLKVQWDLGDGSPGGAIEFFADPEQEDRILVADGPGGDTAVLNSADLDPFTKRPEDFPRVERTGGDGA